MSKLQLQSEMRARNNLELELQEVKRALLEKENEFDTMQSEMAGMSVLKKTNERLYSELTTLQTQLKKLEQMNASGFSITNSGLQFQSHNQMKPIPGIPEERLDLQIMEQLEQLEDM